MQRLSALAFFLALVLSGCSLFPPGGGAERPMLTTDQTAYDAGERLTLRLENRTDEQFGYNLCFAMLERRAKNGWAEVEGGWIAGDGACPAILIVLRPGQTGTFTETLRSDLSRGTYRFTERVEVGDDYDERTLVSNTFVIR